MNLLPKAALAAFQLVTASALAQVDPNSGADFITIGAPGNLAYNRDDPFNRVAGRRRV